MNTLSIAEKIRDLLSEHSHPGLSDAAYYQDVGHEAARHAAAALVEPLEASHGELLAALQAILAFKPILEHFEPHVIVDLTQRVANAEKLNTKQ